MFIKLADWRNPNPINSMQSLMGNFHITVSRIISDLVYSEMRYIILVLFSFIILSQRRIPVKAYFWSVIIFSSFYFSNIYHGIIISYRSLLTSFVALFILFMFLKPPYRSISLILCSFILLAFNFEKVIWFKDVSSTVAQRFNSISHIFNGADGKVYVHWNKNEEYKFFFDTKEQPFGIEHINDFEYRQVRPYLLAQGFDNVQFLYTNTEYMGVVRTTRIDDHWHIYFE
ncbi:hypothetical protein [Vibrio superstes]|uniref:hypothetical protein n=1 Tax=Vibrio superstes TaxID=198815 RepID=UPI0011BF9D1B|nr:hypothetical protein [Vibrio superstes]